MVHGTYRAYEPAPIVCTVVPDGNKKDLLGITDLDKIEISAKTSDGEDIRILGFEQSSEFTTFHNGSKTIWKGSAKYLIKGQLKSFRATGSEIHCSLFIPYTPLAMTEGMYNRSSNGTITLRAESRREGIKWSTPLGQAELIDGYEYIDDKVGSDAATIRLRRCQVHLAVKPKGKYSLETLIRGLPDLFDETFRLVSFLSRKRIVWYAAEAAAFSVKDKPGYRLANAYRQSWLGFQEVQPYEQTWIDLLVAPKELRKGLFERLHQNFQASKYKTLIKRTIPFLTMSYEQGYFESHIANTYSALETMVAGLSSDEDSEIGILLPKVEFRGLTKKLLGVIWTEVGDKAIRERMSGKLEELNRRPILDRLMALLETHRVPTDKLWPPNTDIKERLGKVLRRRNLYIHQGRIDDFGQYYDDYSRLRTLVELWILKLLDCPDEAINTASIRF